jgi:hypothetical protein
MTVIYILLQFGIAWRLGNNGVTNPGNCFVTPIALYPNDVYTAAYLFGQVVPMQEVSCCLNQSSLFAGSDTFQWRNKR